MMKRVTVFCFSESVPLFLLNDEESNSVLFSESVPLFLLNDEEEGPGVDVDSDFEVDPCTITPPDHPSSPFSGISDTLPQMDDILSHLDGKILNALAPSMVLASRASGCLYGHPNP